MPISLFGQDAPVGPSSAILSADRTYRYALERRWGSGPFVLFVMLNPSTAVETEDDPTVRRCVRFAKDWGYGGLLVGNLYALRAAYPSVLKTRADPVGPDNDVWLTTMSCRSSLIVAAWGANGMVPRREPDMRALLGDRVACLGRTAGGHPRHPLYLRRTTTLETWDG